MKGIITCVNCMTCMFAVSLTLGGPIRRQATQSEQTVSIGGNFTLLCPFSPDDTWIWVYWKKNNVTIYSLDVQSITPWTNSTRYEVSKHATRLTIKDLKKTDSGMYHCKVVTRANTNFTKEGGQVLLYVTGLSNTSPGVPFSASTMIPPQPAEDNTVFLKIIFPISIIASIIISVIIMCLCFKYRQRVVSAFRRRTAQMRVTQLPPVGPVLTDDLCMASNRLVADRMRNVLHSLIDLHEEEDELPKDGKYSFIHSEYEWCIRKGVRVDVEYLLDRLGHIPVGRRRDVYEILLTMPEYQQVDNPKFNFTEDMYLEYAQVKAVKGKLTSMTNTLEEKMRYLLGKSETRDTTRNDISTIILYAPVENAGFASSSQYASSRLNQSANQMEQNTSVLPQRDGDLERKDDNLIKFWKSKLMKLQPKVQIGVMKQLGYFLQDADCSSMKETRDPPNMQNSDAKRVKKTDVNESTDRERAIGHPDMKNVDAKNLKIFNMNDSTDVKPQHLESVRPMIPLKCLSSEKMIDVHQQSGASASNDQLAAEASWILDTLERTARKKICDTDQEKTMGRLDMQNDDAQEVNNTILNENTDRNKKSTGIPGEKEMD